MVHIVDQTVGINVVVEGPHLDVACRKNQIRIIHRIHDVHRAQLPGREFIRIDVNHDLSILASKRRRNLRSLDDRDLVANRELADVVKLRLIEPFSFQRDQADRQTRSIELQHHGRQRSRRQPLQIRQRQVRQLGHVRVSIRSRLKVDLNDADTQQRARFHVINAAG